MWGPLGILCLSPSLPFPTRALSLSKQINLKKFFLIIGMKLVMGVFYFPFTLCYVHPFLLLRFASSLSFILKKIVIVGFIYLF